MSQEEDYQALGSLARRGLDKGRLEALTDGILAVAMTILVLDLKLEASDTITTDAHLLRHLLDVERTFNVYFVGFVVLGMYWIAHNLQVHYVRHVDRTLLWINLAFMLLVTLVPFATNMMITYELLTIPIVFYGLVQLLLAVALIANVNYLGRRPELADESLTPAVVAFIRRRLVLFATIPVVATAVAFVNTRAGLSVYFLMLVMHFFPHHVDRTIDRIARRKGTGESP